MATFSELINSNTPVLVDFYADWCGPCHMQSPILQEVSAEISGKAKIVKVDVDRNQQASMQYQIRSIPTLILFKNGKAVWRKTGVAQKSELLAVIEANA